MTRYTQGYKVQLVASLTPPQLGTPNELLGTASDALAVREVSSARAEVAWSSFYEQTPHPPQRPQRSRQPRKSTSRDKATVEAQISPVASRLLPQKLAMAYQRRIRSRWHVSRSLSVPRVAVPSQVSSTPNPTPHSVAREAPRQIQTSQPRAGGRERYAP